MKKLKVMIVEKKVVHRRAVADIVECTGKATVIHAAPNDSIALEWLEQSEIDVVVLGAETFKNNESDIFNAIRKIYPAIEIILLVENDTPENMKSSLDSYFTSIMVKKFMPNANENKNSPVYPLHSNTKFLPAIPDLVVIASSTGGPAALEAIFTKLPDDFPKPVLVIQHMPPGFTSIFAGSMDKKCALGVIEAGEGDLVNTGRILVAPGGMHMAVERLNCGDVAVKLLDLPFVNGVKPSADILFESVARTFDGGNILAVVLTGMGSDGMNGVLELKKRCNCYCLTQSEDSCVVYGMPKCVSDAGLSDEVADLRNIAGRICSITYNGVGSNES